MAFRLGKTAALASLFFLPCIAPAQARFDLPGPKIDIRVTRAGVTLPIASVPNLQPNDQIWLHPDLPASQSVHYLLIAAFLRGTTNPPPDSWFFRIETWQKRVREEGVIVTVPPEAQQAVLFLAPETGGDFSTLRSAVKGRPGIFVRASQDLNEAGFEQARIEKYLAELKRVSAGDSASLTTHSDLLARTLNLKPNPDCFKRSIDLQYACLTQTGTQTLLDDGHAQSIAASLSNGPSSDLINQASYTGLAGAGVYSAYVGAIVDLVRLTSGLHTAKYQYIPAIAFPAASGDAEVPTPENTPGSPPATGEALSLRLNTAPSFNNPKSVIVIGLPAVLPAVLPPLRPVDPAHISCLLNPDVVLPIDGAPLVFSTAFAHSLVLHLNRPGTPGPYLPSSSPSPPETAAADIPLTPDAFLGGLVLSHNTPDRRELPLNPPAPSAAPSQTKPVAGLQAHAKNDAPAQTTPAHITPGQPVTANIQGMWGFDHFSGPTVALQVTPGGNWRLVAPPESPASTPTELIAGQPNHLQLLATGTACIQSIALQPSDTRVEWKLATPSPAQPAAQPAVVSPLPAAPTPLPEPVVRPVELTLNLQHAATPGSIQLDVQQFGQKSPDHLGTRTFAEPARIASLLLHAGDTAVDLTGTSLDQVTSVSLPTAKAPLTFVPAPCPASSSPDPACASSTSQVTLALPQDARPPTFKPNEHVVAAVHLADGRILDVHATILPPRPSLVLLSSHNTPSANTAVQLASPSDLPLGAQLTFFLKSPTPFPRAEQVEIANLDASLHTTLSIAAGSLILQDSHTVLATFDPLKTFGPSTFGPFHLRALAPSNADIPGTSGAWIPLTTIVRLPTITSIHCPAAPAAACTLSGSALYLIDSISTTLDFASPTQVPEGFVDTTLEVPHPSTSTPVAGPGAAPAPSLYIRLRDNPASNNEITLPIQTDPAPPAPRATHARSTAPLPGR